MRVPKKHTLADAITRFRKEVLGPKGIKGVNQAHHLDYWEDQLGEFTLADITAANIAECRQKLVGKKNRFGREVNLSTANRFTTSLNHLFNIAVREWEWLEANPASRIRKYKEPRGRVRFLADQERKALLSVCRESNNWLLYPIVVTALSTGARKMEIIGLKWQDIDFNRKVIVLDNSKNGERRVLPLQGHANSLLADMAKIKNSDKDYVFASPKKNQPIDIRAAWEAALVKANIQDFRFHDLRHSAASYLAMNGASLAEIAEVLGHKTLQMVKRYAHLSEAHTSSVVASMNEKIFANDL